MKLYFVYMLACIKFVLKLFEVAICTAISAPIAFLCLKKFKLPQKKRLIKYRNRCKIALYCLPFRVPEKLKNKQITVLPCADAGFFSIFNNYVSHLVYVQKNEILLPDWTLSRLILRNFHHLACNNFKLLSFCYGTKEDGNIFYKLFENPYSEIDADIYETDNMYHYAKIILPDMDYNEEKEPNLTGLNSYNLYSDAEYFPVFRKKYNDTLKKYIRLKPDIQQKINNFAEKKLKGCFVVSAFIRCKGHALELKGNSPDIELWETKLLGILNQNNISVSSDKWRFFIASDNDDAIHYFSEKYPENTVFQNMQRLTHEQEQEYENKKKELGHDTWGYELQHRKAADETQHSLQNAIDVIFDVYTAASADYLIYTNSNMSTAASYINPDLKMVYCKKEL